MVLKKQTYVITYRIFSLHLACSIVTVWVFIYISKYHAPTTQPNTVYLTNQMSFPISCTILVWFYCSACTVLCVRHARTPQGLSSTFASIFKSDQLLNGRNLFLFSVFYVNIKSDEELTSCFMLFA